MRMNLTRLAFLVEKAAEAEPLLELPDVYGSYYRPYYHLLYLLARWAKSEDLLCVELGVEQGRGCANMAMSGARVMGIDHTPRPDQWAAIGAMFPNVSFVEAESLPVPPQVTGPIGVLHVDTEHTYAQAREELKGYAPYLADGAVVCFDDLHAMNGAVAHFFCKLPYPKIADDRLHECGYGAIVFHEGETIPE